MLAVLTKYTNNPWLSITFGGLVLILAAALAGVIQHYFNGEEFYVLQYAHNFSHIEAWQRFFFQNGRLIEGIYWTYQYKLLGYNPLLSHSLSFVLVLIASVAATACFANAWPKNKRNKLLLYLLAFLFFTNWVLMSSVLRFSYDNTRLSVALFFLAGLALQKWASTQRSRWLVPSFFMFLLSLLTYENAAFLFPALLILAWPLLPASKEKNIRQKLFAFVGLAFLSGLIVLFPSWFYGWISRTEQVTTPVMELELASTISYLLNQAPAIYLQFGQFGIVRMSPLNILVSAGLLLTLALSTLWIVTIHRNKRLVKPAEKLGWTSVYFSSLWFLVLGPLPYVLLGYGVGGRVYSSAIFGLFPLTLMVYVNAKKLVLRIAAIVLVVFFAGLGISQLADESMRFSQSEELLNNFYLGMKEAVPHVRPHTIFIIIDSRVGYSGCGPSLEILYDQVDLDCALVSAHVGSHAIRRPLELETDGLGFQGPDWIVIRVVDNVPQVIEELKPGDFDLQIAWESTEPIVTNWGRIITSEIPPPSQFYSLLLRRQAALEN